MIVINNVKVSLDFDFYNMKPTLAHELHCKTDDITYAELYKKSIDARHKDDVHFLCSFIADGNFRIDGLKNAMPYNKKIYKKSVPEKKPEMRPVIIGFGPAGLFSALTLAEAGLCPIVFERGKDVDSRIVDVENFRNGGALNTESNIQFGEGGAGTFSDGKLNSGIKDPRSKHVLESFVKFGAERDIIFDARPHIGTDKLRKIIKNIREEIIRLGGEVHFESKFECLNTENGTIKSVTVNGKEILCDRVILGIGHSARDTFHSLFDSGVKMEAKPFSIGARIEHKRVLIDRSQYGTFASHPAVGAAYYKLADKTKSGTGVYSFCMCPGGEVVNASSEEDGVAVNGMSYSSRDGENSNSAILVGVEPEYFGKNVFDGIELQRKIETAAKKKGGPVSMTVGDFLNRKSGSPFSVVKPSIKPAPIKGNLRDILPEKICNEMAEGIKIFARKIRGFDSPAAVLTGPETRSSSPVRILRDRESFESETLGLFPCGEGAGYAGGIMSAAVDGIRTAEAVIKSFH